MRARFLIILLCMASCSNASAHAFVQQYSLPVPFSLYAGGATIALVLSFLAAVVLAKSPKVNIPIPIDDKLGHVGLKNSSVSFGRIFTTILLGLCIISGFIGTSDAFANINMTLFWIILFLGVPYAVVIFGDFYASINPWNGLISLIENFTGKAFLGRIEFPVWLGHFPGLILYIVLIILELFGQLRPLGLSVALATYSLIMLLGAWIFGKNVWLARAEVFGIICRLLGMMSMDIRLGIRGMRMPLTGLLTKQPVDLGLILFVLFMLSSTAYDGLHATVPWVGSYWKYLYPHITWVDTVWSTGTQNRYAASTALYGAWQWIALIVSPFGYFAIFAFFLRFSGITGQSKLSTLHLMRRFTFCLIPIAFVYHLSHYLVLLLMQGPQIFKLISDPFGFGWNLFGTVNWSIRPITFDIDIIWHTQVALIILGHMASVLVAHFESLFTFKTPRLATLSQVPMLCLMVVFTASGLWILSLPISPTS